MGSACRGALLARNRPIRVNPEHRIRPAPGASPHPFAARHLNALRQRSPLPRPRRAPGAVRLASQLRSFATAGRLCAPRYLGVTTRPRGTAPCLEAGSGQQVPALARASVPGRDRPGSATESALTREAERTTDLIRTPSDSRVFSGQLPVQETITTAVPLNRKLEPGTDTQL